MNRAVRTLVTVLALSLTACATPVPQALTPTLGPKSFIGQVLSHAEYAHRIVNPLYGAVVTENIRQVL